ncbi:MAG: hypothetical protein E7241_00650 [Lachnospiraceae bacterium]|nr:hypothetical protein [Lachnospiraceae bacterium]
MSDGTGIYSTSMYLDACCAIHGACFLPYEWDSGDSILLADNVAYMVDGLPGLPSELLNLNAKGSQPS